MSDMRDLGGVHRLAYDGAIDADGHILEPPDLWERYLDPKFRDRALRIVRDADGLEELEIGGRRSTRTSKGMPSLLGVMGAPDLMTIPRDPERTYVTEAAYGSFDPAERLRLLDAEGLDAAVLYPTLGLLWEAELGIPNSVRPIHAPTTAGSASSPRIRATVWYRRPICRCRIRRRRRRNSNVPWGRGHEDASSCLSRIVDVRWLIPPTIGCSPRPRIWTWCWHYILVSSRIG